MSKRLTTSELEQLKEGLLYLKMGELRNVCERLGIFSKGVKTQLIESICFFARKGKHLPYPKMPAVSKAKKGETYPLAQETKMLKGSYKNDLATRQFFKHLVGSHFHFTAFGIDWLNQCWMEGNPPTYQEFAMFWQEEYQKRKNQRAPAKKEWAYINFVQEYNKQYPNACRTKIINAWKETQKHHFEKVLKLLEPLLDVT